MTAFANAIKETTKTKKTSKKSTCPVIDDAPKNVKEAVDMVVAGKRGVGTGAVGVKRNGYYI